MLGELMCAWTDDVAASGWVVVISDGMCSIERPSYLVLDVCRQTQQEDARGENARHRQLSKNVTSWRAVPAVSGDSMSRRPI